MQPTARERLEAGRRQANATLLKAKAAFQSGAITGHELQCLELVAEAAIGRLADHVRQVEAQR